jgi:hypothetical protein
VNRDKHELYDKAIDVLGVDTLLDVFHVFLVEMIFHTMTFRGTKTEENEIKLIESLAGIQIMQEIIILHLKQENKEQSLWTKMHYQLDNMKKLVEDKEREKDADSNC